MFKLLKSFRSFLEVIRKSIKLSDSFRSICSDSSSKGFFFVVVSFLLVIFKVRIKIIKILSGEIKRTVIRILLDFDDFSKFFIGLFLGSVIVEVSSEVLEDEVIVLFVVEYFFEVGIILGSF